MDSWTVSLVIFPTLCLGHSQKACNYQIIYCFKHRLLIVFFCPRNRWNPILLFSIMTSLSQLYLISPRNLFLFSLHAHTLLFGPPSFFYFTSPCSVTQQSSFIFHINPALSLASGHDSNFNLFRNHFPIDQTHYFHSIQYFSLIIMFLCLASRCMPPSHWIVKSRD